MAASIKIDQLTGDNYDTWKIHMRAILKKNDLWEYVSGAILKPPPSDPKYTEWLKMDGKAESDILLAVSSSELAALDGLESSRAIWDKLKSMYQSSGPARKASLLKKLVLTRMKEDDDLKKHIADFFEAVKKLREIGLIVIDELLAILLLYSLPDSFAMFRTAIESRDDLPSTESLKVKIIEDFEGRKSQTVDQGAMFVKRINKNTHLKKNCDNHGRKAYVECYRCGRRGHIVRDCKVKYMGKHKKSAQQVERDGDNERKTTMLLSTTEDVLLGEQINPIWCIDSGCTGHMCNEKQMIEDFTQLNSELNLANSERTQITGTGKVSISVDTGSEERQINLQNVFYVSDLRTNLLSVAKMTDRGFEVHFKKNDATVCDENGKIHLRADRVGNLYHVRMSQNTASNVENKKKSIDIWHQRLGHLNERDLKAMSKSGLVYGLTFNDHEKLSECDVCASEKLACVPFPKSSGQRTTELLEIVHSDVCGPMKTQSYGEILDEEESIDSEQMNIELNEPVSDNSTKSEDQKILRVKRNRVRTRRSLERVDESDFDRNRRHVDRKRIATVSWEELIEPPKRGRGRPRLIRTGMAGRPRKIYNSSQENSDSENESEDREEQLSAGIATIEPMTWNEIENSDDLKAWQIALEDEILAQLKNKTWEIVPRPKQRKVIGSRLVLSTKSTGKKVRLVAKGCSQRPGEDFHETSSPVVRTSSIRLIAALSAELGLEIHQMDVVTAYLNGSLEEEVYMEVPDQLSDVLERVLANEKVGSQKRTVTEKNILKTAKSWHEALNECVNSVCLLKKSLYGLRQSGLQWHKELVRKLVDCGFERLQQDPCVFVAQKGNYKFINKFSPQPISSEPSKQSSCLSHFHARGIHDPEAHLY
ncbi:unnamed protein product [Danaus chrysippus]|uniref:(African queen) hypothetical protein n=1 Tax=Danaus chrysippus TaxID=151541 RepID=A0A8J2R527_9NEOP|nr:unnamed protein product [Danaus chrysippus]